MTDHHVLPARLRLVPMRPRDPHEPGRAATSLELFFDLVFVVAVSIAAAQLHHQLAEGHFVDGLFSYAVVFFGIWWAWMNFTWFATSFDTDDWLYRVLTILQMGGVLVLAAGIEPVFVDRDFTVLTLGYVVMRVVMVAQWLRASRRAGASRKATLTYALGIVSVQLLWLVMLVLPHGVQPYVMVLLVAAELSVPLVAERNGLTPWHPHHVTERYGCFTLIVLGESLLASANAVIGALHDEATLGPLIWIAILALVVTASLWWLYFWPPHHRAITSLRRSLRYGYVHYFVFASAGAFSAGVELEIDQLTQHLELSPALVTLAVSGPVAVFLLGVWWIAIRDHADRVVNTAIPVAAVLVLLDPLLPVPITLTAVIMALLVVVLVLRPPLPEAES